MLVNEKSLGFLQLLVKIVNVASILRVSLVGGLFSDFPNDVESLVVAVHIAVARCYRRPEVWVCLLAN